MNVFDLRFFRDSKGQCPLLKALDKLPIKARAKGYVRIEQLQNLGNKLTRPESDFLRDGIYELRWRYVKVQYRILYFFAGEKIIVLSHVITKENEIPNTEIERCIANKKLFEKNPEEYTYTED
jgi:phage-related protein